MASFLVTHLSMNAYGGAERVCHHIMRSLVEHGQRVDLLSFRFNKNTYKTLIGEDMPKEVTVYELNPDVKVKPPFTIYKRFYAFLKSLVEFQKKNCQRYDFLFLTRSSPFESIFMKDYYNKAVSYIHFPEIHYEYEKSKILRRIYLKPFIRWIEKSVKNLDLIFCNSYYTKKMIVRFWGTFYTKDIKVIYPPVDLKDFWGSRSLDERANRVVYIGRFIPAKRHDIMKKLAKIFPDYEFVSVGLLDDGMKEWFEKFLKNAPKNYVLKPNLPKNELKELLQESKIYIHLMEGEHFGIAPIEALASGCITLVPENSGVKEFIPEVFRWKDEEDLKNKLLIAMNFNEESWSLYKGFLWQRIKELDSKNFRTKIWNCLKKAYPHYL